MCSGGCTRTTTIFRFIALSAYIFYGRCDENGWKRKKAIQVFFDDQKRIRFQREFSTLTLLSSAGPSMRTDAMKINKKQSEKNWSEHENSIRKVNRPIAVKSAAGKSFHRSLSRHTSSELLLLPDRVNLAIHRPSMCESNQFQFIKLLTHNNWCLSHRHQNQITSGRCEAKLHSTNFRIWFDIIGRHVSNMSSDEKPESVRSEV